MNFGINIVLHSEFPVYIYDDDTGELLEIIHMVQSEDTVYVSRELYDALRDEIPKRVVEE